VFGNIIGEEEDFPGGGGSKVEWNGLSSNIMPRKQSNAI